jgi:hypothetical protein
MVLVLLPSFGEEVGLLPGLGIPALRFARRLDSRAVGVTDGTASSDATTTPGFFEEACCLGASFFVDEGGFPGLLLAGGGVTFFVGEGGFPGLLLVAGGVDDRANSASASLSLLFET